MQEIRSSIIISTGTPINLRATLFSGQSFLWDSIDDKEGIFASVINGRIILLQQLHASAIAATCNPEITGHPSLPDIITEYLSLRIDPESTFPDNFSSDWPAVADLLARGEYRSLRVVRQEPFEALCTFLCAQGIGMGLIRRQVSLLRHHFGKPVTATIGGRHLRLHAFPSPTAIAEADLEELQRCTNNNRVRANNLREAARQVAGGCLDLTALSDPALHLEQVRTRLMACGGIGPKIADCVALYGLGRFDAFPIDTHVHQYLHAWFRVEGEFRALTPRHYLFLQEEARRILGTPMAGFAGHLLFHCWRREVKRLASC